MITHNRIKQKQYTVKGNSVRSSKSLFERFFLIQSCILVWNNKTGKQSGIFVNF